MFCPNCGNEVHSEGVFCSSCGEQIEQSGEVDGNAKNRSNHAEPYNAAVHTQAKQGKKVYIILGWIFFAVSILFIPILFGAGAFIMGYLVRKENNETHGVILMVMAIAGAIIGTLLGAAASAY